MRIGEMARCTGVSERMLRYYEQEGLLQPVRTNAGYRDYGNTEVQAAKHISTLSNAGLTLATIRILLPCIAHDQPRFEPCNEVRAILRQEVGKLDEKLRALGESRQVIAGFLRSVDADGVSGVKMGTWLAELHNQC